MANEKSIAHELLAQEILKNFKGKITGDNADYIVGENPENRYFVGKLLPVSDSQTSSWGSDVFIESIGADFYITPDEISSAQLTIYPRGDFYYRAYPTLEQQRTAMLQKANELFETRFTDFEELVSKYQEDPSAFSKVKEKLVPVYKKVQIHKTHFSLVFSLHELLEGNPQYGYADANHAQNKQFEQYLNDLQSAIMEDEYCYTHELYEKTTLKDLLSEEDYKKFIKKNAKQGTPIRQNWNVYIDITIKLIKDKYLISVALVNGSQVQSNGVTHMRYIPLSAHERGYVGSQWNAKFLRAVQRMLVPTQGKGVCSRSFFEADFGKNADDFVRFLSMPEKLIAARGKISTTSRGKASETEEQFAIRKAGWERDQKKIQIWNSLYAKLGDEQEDFINLIGDNEYLPEKVLGIASTIQRKLYILYLTTPRLVALLGMIDKNSPTYSIVKAFIIEECPDLYKDILDILADSEVQQNYIFKNFADFFGRDGVSDLLKRLVISDFAVDKQLSKWDLTSKKEGIGYIDFELIRVYRRFIDLNVLSEDEHEIAQKCILEMDMTELASILATHIEKFESLDIDNSDAVIEAILNNFSAQ